MVLVFDKRPVGPAYHKDGQLVFPGMDIIRDVELGGGPGILRHADLGAVDIDDILAHMEIPPVDSAWILLRHVGRRVIEWHADIDIVGRVKTLPSPVPWHRKAGSVPMAATGKQPGGHLFGAFEVPEVPLPIQRLDCRTLEGLV